MSDEEVFSHHEACPSCGSQDNVGVWKDGHKYCFGCGWKSAGTRSISSMKARLEELAEDDRTSGTIIDTRNHTISFPREVIQWLTKYGISKQEISFYRLRWDTSRESLVFPVYSGDTLVLTNERYFGSKKDHPKYLTQGRKNSVLPVIMDKGNKSDTLIFVEDFVSAIKVGRQFPTTPLLGASLAIGSVLTARQRFKNCRIWLDMDKAVKSLQEASKASQYMNASSIFTQYDPKEYTDDEIRSFVKATTG